MNESSIQQVEAVRALARRYATPDDAARVDHIIALGKSGALDGGPSPLPTLRGGAMPPPPGRTASLRGGR